jgi:hypothetical protein
MWGRLGRKVVGEGEEELDRKMGGKCEGRRGREMGKGRGRGM